MKTLVFAGAILALGVISCEKEEIQVNQKREQLASVEEQQSMKDENLNQGNLKSYEGTTRYFFDNGEVPGIDGTDYGCDDGGHGCYDEMIATPQLEGLIDDIGSSSDSEIIDLFDNNESVFDRYIDNGIVDDVIAGNVSVGLRGTISSSSNIYLIFRKNNTAKTIVGVVPFHL